MADDESRSSSSELAALLEEFPPISAGFAYGSAVFGQRGYSDAQRHAAMLDLIFVVDDARSWHAANMERQAGHYSGISRLLLGPSGVAYMQEQIGAGIYYNHAEVQGRLIKYGVISRTALEDDLEHWSSLYVSGRFQKPVRAIGAVPTGLNELVEQNLRSAVRSSLLLLPSRFEASELFGTICGLSYGGDVRMGIGESNLKPVNIAAGQHEVLERLYLQPFADVVGASGGNLGDVIEQDVSLEARQTHLAALPSHLQSTLLAQLLPRATGAGAATIWASRYDVSGTSASSSSTATRLGDAARELWLNARGGEEAADRQLQAAVRRSLSLIVRRSSLAQTAKGIATAGIATSLMYAAQKMRKRSAQDARG